MSIKRTGNKVRIAMCLFLLILSMNMVGCGLGDWGYDNLPGDYSIERINSQNILLCKREGNNSYSDNQGTVL